MINKVKVARMVLGETEVYENGKELFVDMYDIYLDRYAEKGITGQDAENKIVEMVYSDYLACIDEAVAGVVEWMAYDENKIEAIIIEISILAKRYWNSKNTVATDNWRQDILNSSLNGKTSERKPIEYMKLVEDRIRELKELTNKLPVQKESAHLHLDTFTNILKNNLDYTKPKSSKKYNIEHELEEIFEKYGIKSTQKQRKNLSKLIPTQECK